MNVHASKSKTLVNNIPMSAVYGGMNAVRFQKLQRLWGDTVMSAILDEDLDSLSEDEFDAVVAQRFYDACQRRATKAGWYARTHNIKRKAFK